MGLLLITIVLDHNYLSFIPLNHFQLITGLSDPTGLPTDPRHGGWRETDVHGMKLKLFARLFPTRSTIRHELNDNWIDSGGRYLDWGLCRNDRRMVDAVEGRPRVYVYY